MGKLMYESCSRVMTAVGIASSVLLFSVGCASGGGAGSLPANTHATLLITATNDAKIPIFKFNIQGVTLLADDGTSVPILTTPQLVELGSINGVARPLVATATPLTSSLVVTGSAMGMQSEYSAVDDIYTVLRRFHYTDSGRGRYFLQPCLFILNSIARCKSQHPAGRQGGRCTRSSHRQLRQCPYYAN